MQIIKSLLAKAWKKEAADLTPGTHYINETLTVHVTGTVEKLDDEYAAPTVSIPLIPTLAYFAERLGVNRDEALDTLRDALHEAMTKNVKEDANIKARMDDVQAAMKAIKKDLIAGLPKMRRDGKILIDGLAVEVESVGELAAV